MKILAIDIGSTFLKSAVLDLETLSVVSSEKYAMPDAFRDSDGLAFEIDANLMFNSFKAVIDNAIEQYNVKGVQLSTQMHGGIFCDKSAVPKTPYFSWQDNRCLRKMEGTEGSYIDYISSKISKEDMVCSGLYFKPGLAVCNAYTMIKQNTYNISDGDYFCAIGAYLIFRLTGAKKCHITNAAPLGIVDVKKHCWNYNLINSLEFEKFRFFDLVDEHEICGYYKGIPVFPDLGDQQVAVLGSLMNSSTDINLNVATAAQIAFITKDFVKGEFENRPYWGNSYLNTITRLPSGRGFDIFVRHISDIVLKFCNIKLSKAEIWKVISRLVIAEKDESLTCDVAYFNDLIGVKYGRFDNIKEDNFTISKILKSLFNKYSQVYAKYINEILKIDPCYTTIACTGGAIVNNNYLKATVSKLTGINVNSSTIKDEVFIGHLLLALVNFSHCDSLMTARKILIKRNSN